MDVGQPEHELRQELRTYRIAVDEKWFEGRVEKAEEVFAIEREVWERQTPVYREPDHLRAVKAERQSRSSQVVA